MVDAVASALSASTQGGAAGSRASLAENFEMFLVLLTEQLKNQDPLSPLDSNEFVNQLVEFSSVEQLINQNDALERLVGLQVASVGGAAVGYLGKEIRVVSPEAHHDTSGARWAYAVDGEAESVSIAVLDAEGKVVFETAGETDAGEQSFVWDGKDATGATLPPGAYTLSVAAASPEGDVLPIAIEAFGTVTGLDLSGAEPVLLMGDARAPFSRVVSVLDPNHTPPNDGGDA